MKKVFKPFGISPSNIVTEIADRQSNRESVSINGMVKVL